MIGIASSYEPDGHDRPETGSTGASESVPVQEAARHSEAQPPGNMELGSMELGSMELPPAEPAEPTGDERVDAVLVRFGDLDGAPMADHVEIFEDVQRGLQDVLASIDHEERDRDRDRDRDKEEQDKAAPQGRPGPPRDGGQVNLTGRVGSGRAGGTGADLEPR